LRRYTEAKAAHQEAVSASDGIIHGLTSSVERNAAAVDALRRSQGRLAATSHRCRQAQDVHAEDERRLAQHELNAVRDAEQIATLKVGQDTLHGMLESAQAELAAYTKRYADLEEEHAATTTQLAAANAEILELQSKAAAAAASSDADAAHAGAAAAAAAAAADTAAAAATAADTNAQNLTGIVVDLSSDLHDARAAVAAAGAATAKARDQLAERTEHQVGRCRLTLSKPVLKAHMVSALETTMC